MKKNDFILIAVVLIIAFTIFAGQRLLNNNNNENNEAVPVAVVQVCGEVYGVYPLSVDREERIELEDGSYNIFSIKDGEVTMIEASCPDKICVNHPAIHSSYDPIVCLPNEVIITVQGNDDADSDNEIDSIAN